MASINEKLNYINETKQLFKDRLNSLGAEIIESTTFRNYLSWLDTFYNQSSDKTDLAKNGVVGKTIQDGDPTPENPVEINNLSGDMAYKVRGKNKLNINASNYSKNGITSSTSNQAITFNGTTSVGWTSSDFNDCFLKANENYIFSISNSNAPGEVKFRIWGYEDESSSLSVNVGTDVTFTPSTNITKIKIVCEQMTTNKNYNIEAKCQIEKGSTPTEYEPHILESFPLSLGDIELCNISDYKDRIYSQNGEFYLEKKNGKAVLDGSESGWGISGTNVSGKNRFANSILSSLILKPSSTSEVAQILSNLFVPKSAVNTYGRINGISFNASGTMYIYYDAIETYSVNDFKTWLSTHNTEVQYVLANPTTTEITQENYPTLYSQLLAIQEFLTKYKINKEFLLDYSSPEIEY